MTKYEWETELKKNIHRLPADEIKRVMEYYGELFEDHIERGKTESQIINEFGNPVDVADKILSEYDGELVDDVSVPALNEAKRDAKATQANEPEKESEPKAAPQEQPDEPTTESADEPTLYKNIEIVDEPVSDDGASEQDPSGEKNDGNSRHGAGDVFKSIGLALLGLLAVGFIGCGVYVIVIAFGVMVHNTGSGMVHLAIGAAALAVGVSIGIPLFKSNLLRRTGENKKLGTKLGLTAATLVGAGVVLFISGMSTLGWDFVRLDGTEYTAKSYKVNDVQSMDTVEISLSSFPVDIVRGKDIGIEYFDSSDSFVDVGYENGVLTVWEKHIFNPFETGLLTVGRGSHRFVLTVPDGVRIKAEGANCDMRMTDVKLDSLYIDVTNLDLNVDLADIENEVYISATNVNANITTLSASSMTVDTVNINLDMRLSSADKMSFSSTNINMDMDRVTSRGLTVSGTNITANCEWLTATAFEIDGTNVNITSQRTTSDKLNVDGVNLNAKIEMIGLESDFTIVTDDGPPQTGNTDKTITLDGVNSNVELSFVISA